jgi:hypothetical protein
VEGGRSDLVVVSEVVNESHLEASPDEQLSQESHADTSMTAKSPFDNRSESIIRCLCVIAFNILGSARQNTNGQEAVNGGTARRPRFFATPEQLLDIECAICGWGSELDRGSSSVAGWSPLRSRAHTRPRLPARDDPSSLLSEVRAGDSEWANPSLSKALFAVSARRQRRATPAFVLTVSGKRLPGEGD